LNLGYSQNELIGKKYAGGLIYYINEADLWGLVVTETEIGSLEEWGCDGTDITGSEGMDIGDGEQNTIDILDECDHNEAAWQCGNLVLNGYDDWFLPSTGSLQEMIFLVIRGIGNFSYTGYWSSSEMDSTNAWVVSFSSNSTTTDLDAKHYTYVVRAVRKFIDE